MSIFREEPSVFNGLAIDAAGKSYLQQMARWTKFLAIFYFVITGFFCLLFPYALLGTELYSFVPGDVRLGMAVGVVLFTLGINFYPLFALLRFAAKIRPALQSDNQQDLNAAFRMMKNFFMYIGILTILVFVLYGVAIAFAITGAM